MSVRRASLNGRIGIIRRTVTLMKTVRHTFYRTLAPIGSCRWCCPRKSSFTIPITIRRARIVDRDINTTLIGLTIAVDVAFTPRGTVCIKRPKCFLAFDSPHGSTSSFLPRKIPALFLSFSRSFSFSRVLPESIIKAKRESSYLERAAKKNSVLPNCTNYKDDCVSASRFTLN